MASIVYVSDSNMIEYHRLNGSDAMNFWRLSEKAFARFQVGDFLFFLDRKERKGREKGMIGYGKLHSIKSMSFSHMWNSYGEKNGYATKLDFKEAILRANKNKGIPKKLTCLYLEEVIFFQGPIFLSEFGITLPTQLESFTYLERDKQDITTEVLRKAQTIGVDVWTSALNETLTSSIFTRDLLLHEVSDHVNRFYLPLTRQQQEITRKFTLEGSPLKQSPGVFYRMEGNSILLFYPVSGLRKALQEKVYSRVTQALLIAKEIEKYQKISVINHLYGNSLESYQEWLEPFSIRVLSFH